MKKLFLTDYEKETIDEFLKNLKRLKLPQLSIFEKNP